MNNSSEARDIVVVGTGGHAREIIALIEDINRAGTRWQLRGALVDSEWRHADQLLGYPILGTPDWLATHRGCAAVIAIGASKHRGAMALRLAALGVIDFPTLIHPRAWVSQRASLGAGCQIMAGALVNADAVLEDLVLMNLGASASHDSRLEYAATLGPGARVAGGGSVGERAEIGMNASVLPRVSVGADAIVGAGAVVTRAVPCNVAVRGNPARNF